VGIPAGAATGGSRAAAAVMRRHDAPQSTRWLRGGQAHTRTSLRREVMTGGWLVGANSAGVATRASRGGGIWRKRELTGGPRLSATAMRET
jgi:hypothetical protein